MRTIEIKVNEQLQEIENNTNNLIENSVNIIKLHFNFEGWKDFNNKYVIFKNKKQKVKVLLDSNSECYVPFSVIKVPSFSFSVLSENDTQRITTNILYIEVNKTIELDNIQEEEELTLLYKQLETLSTVSNKELESLKDLIKNLKVETDLTEVTTKLDTIQNMQQSLISMINGMINQVLNGTNRLPDMNTTLTENNTNIKDLQKKIGNDTDKNDGTLFHHAYWAMIRAEQAHADTQKILAALNVTPTTIEEIENSKKY